MNWLEILSSVLSSISSGSASDEEKKKIQAEIQAEKERVARQTTMLRNVMLVVASITILLSIVYVRRHV